MFWFVVFVAGAFLLGRAQGDSDAIPEPCGDALEAAVTFEFDAQETVTALADVIQVTGARVAWERLNDARAEHALSDFRPTNTQIEQATDDAVASLEALAASQQRSEELRDACLTK
jgi:hypothetical protein